MTPEQKRQLPNLAWLEGTYERIKSDLLIIPTLQTGDEVSYYEARLRNEILCLDTQARRVGNDVKSMVDARREEISRQTLAGVDARINAILSRKVEQMQKVEQKQDKAKQELQETIKKAAKKKATTKKKTTKKADK